MFNFISEWLSNFAGYLILLTVIVQVIPNNEFQKYVKFICGLILILLLMTPVMEMLGMDEKMWEIYESKEYEILMDEFEEQASMLTGE